MNALAMRLLPLVLALAIQTASGQAQSSRETIERTLPRIVKIFGAGGIHGLHAYSTGFLISPEGHVATVWSHVLDTETVSVVLNNGRRFEAKVLGAEPQLDLAVLKLKAQEHSFPYFDLSQAGSAGTGTRIFAFSNMFKVATGDEPVSVLRGVIAARTRLATRRGTFDVPYDGPVYIVDAITNNSGAGGGVVTTRDGKLLGMIGRQLRNAQSNTWVNYAIPIRELWDIIEQIITGRYESRDEKPADKENPNRYQPVDFGMVMLPDVLFRTPAYLGSVLPGSVAAQAGLRPDDLILFVNDELIQSTRMLAAGLGRLEAGDSLRIIVRRGDRLVSVEMAVVKKTQK